MTQIEHTRAAKYFLLQDIFKGFKLGMKYFFAPKVTVNYPYQRCAPVVSLTVATALMGATPAAANGEGHPDVATLMEEVCAAEFDAMATAAPNVMSVLSSETREEGVSVRDFATGVVTASQVAVFQATVDVADPANPVLRSDLPEQSAQELEALTNAATCLTDEFGMVVNGVDLDPADAAVGLSDILNWSTTALATAGEESP